MHLLDVERIEDTPATTSSAGVLQITGWKSLRLVTYLILKFHTCKLLSPAPSRPRGKACGGGSPRHNI